MHVDQYLNDPRSRRRFFAGAGVALTGTSAMFLAACGTEDKGGGSDKSLGAGAGSGPGNGNDKGQASDVDLLNSALDLEHMAVAAYTAGAKLLKGDALAIGKQFLSQEQEHADGLTQAIKQLGGKPRAALATYDFPQLGSQQDVLKFANDLEHTAVKAYVDVLPRLRGADLRATAAAIVTNEAEHISVLLGALGLQQVPTAFVTGQAAS